MATRYSQETKDEVVAFIEKYNEENGRGGQSAAASKYNLNPITIRSWMEKAGVATPRKKKGKGGRPKGSTNKKKAARKVAAPKAAAPRAAASTGDASTDALGRMLAIKKELAALEGEYEKLKSKI
ncbi:MAG: hypothetical protein AAF236_10530 [Verrucomicrobiota bacterium]